MVKEELVKFDNTPLFPERKAYTVNYKLSEIEAALYESVTDYVKTEMGKADQLTGSRPLLFTYRAEERIDGQISVQFSARLILGWTREPLRRVGE